VTHVRSTLLQAAAVLCASICCLPASFSRQALAINTPIDGPNSLALDDSGHLFVSSLYEDVVRRVDLKTGATEAVAGNGKDCCYTEGAKATDVSLSDGVWALAVNSYGDLFISEGSQVRKVDSATGLISNFAGEGSEDSGKTEDGLLATSANFSMIWGLAVDARGNLFISDVGQNQIFKVDAAGRSSGKVSVVAGDGRAGFSGDGGSALTASFNSPEGIAFDKSGNLVVADRVNCRLRRIDLKTGIINTILLTEASQDCAEEARHNWPMRGPDFVAIDPDGGIAFSITAWNMVERFSEGSGQASVIAGHGDTGFSGDGGPASGALLNGPSGLVVDSMGNLIFADLANNRVRRINAATKIIQTIVGNGLPLVRHPEL